jgi:hypothetical protein
MRIFVGVSSLVRSYLGRHRFAFGLARNVVWRSPPRLLFRSLPDATPAVPALALCLLCALLALIFRLAGIRACSRAANLTGTRNFRPAQGTVRSHRPASAPSIAISAWGNSPLCSSLPAFPRFLLALSFAVAFPTGFVRGRE